MRQLAGPETIPFLDGTEHLSREQARERTWLSQVGDRRWVVNDSTIDDYSRRANVMGHSDGLLDIITRRLGTREDNVGLDLAAGTNARALRNLLDSGVLQSALATNFEDRRSGKVARRGDLSHIDGDLTQPDTWQAIAAWKEQHAEQGLALVMHRPIGGLQHLPARTYKGAAHFMLDLVRPGGLMFTQVPRSLAARSRKLASTCSSIKGRPDVGDVITSRPRDLPFYVADESDLYAVILKKD